MVKFTIDELQEGMRHPLNVRNFALIAAVDHGKTTLIDSLAAAGGLIGPSEVGSTRFLDTRQDEQDRCITVKTSSFSISLEIPEEKMQSYLVANTVKRGPGSATTAPKGKGKGKAKASDEGDVPSHDTTSNRYTLSVVDTPGLTAFSSETIAALRLVDGVIVCVDSVEGMSFVHSESLLRQAIAEQLRPTLMMNKIDRLILELQLDSEEIYSTLHRSIESVNVVIATYQTDDSTGDLQVDPSSGNVLFGSGLHGWGFTLTNFARMYASKFGIAEDRIIKRLWGDNYFDSAAKKWTTNRTGKGSSTLERSFCQFVMGPIKSLTDACIHDEMDKVTKMLKALNITLNKEEKELRGKRLYKCCMAKFLPLSDALVEMVTVHLPSPVAAQRYRISSCYKGALDDDCATAMKACDADGVVNVYICKMLPTSDAGRYFAFGRVFSGTLEAGARVRILGPKYEPGKKNDLFVKSVQRTVVFMGRHVEVLESVPAGNLVGIVGIDQYVVNCGTVTTSDECAGFKQIHPIAAPIVEVSVEPTNAVDLPALVEGLRRLSKATTGLVAGTGDDGIHYVRGGDELHLEVALGDLRALLGDVQVLVSEPHVCYRETVTVESPTTTLAISPNSHNRIYVTAEPLSGDLVQDIEAGKHRNMSSAKDCARWLSESHDWDVLDGRKIWAFSDEDQKANLIVDRTKGVQYLNEIKDSIVAGFHWTSGSGPLCDEPLRGVRFNLIDCLLHADAIHRGGGQIIPTIRRAMYGAMLEAEPTLQEPMYMCDIMCPEQALGGVYSTLNMRRGVVFEQFDQPGTPLTTVRTFLPVEESFGFVAHLRSNTAGLAFPQMNYDHWANVSGMFSDPESRVAQRIKAIRLRKGMSEAPRGVEHYADKQDDSSVATAKAAEAEKVVEPTAPRETTPPPSPPSYGGSGSDSDGAPPMYTEIAGSDGAGGGAIGGSGESAPAYTEEAPSYAAATENVADVD